MKSEVTHRPDYFNGVNRIVMMGDSITESGDPDGYVAMVRAAVCQLGENTAIEVINAGTSGNKSNDMLHRLAEDVLAHHPQILTLSVGINDVWHGYDRSHPDGDGPAGISLGDYTRYVTEIVEQTCKAHIKVILLSPTIITESPDDPQNRKLRAYVESEKQIAAKYGCKFINLHEIFLEGLRLIKKQASEHELCFTTDGVHLNHAGNVLMANAVLNELGIMDGNFAHGSGTATPVV